MSDKPHKNPDICERCGREPATVHLRRVTEGEEVELHLCVACAQGEGLEPLAGQGVSEDPVALLIRNLEETEGSGGVCPSCGLTFGMFRETGRLGCARCYETFSAELEPLLRRIHGTTRHGGKSPPRGGERYQQASLLRRLNEELERAVGDEDYERAAALRDRILRAEEDGTASQTDETSWEKRS